MKTTNFEPEIDTAVVPGASQKGRTRTSFNAIVSSPYLHIPLLIILVALCFGRTLTSYFLADDFGEVSYVSRIFNGEPQLLLSNFTGNYMQIPGMNVYRPWLLVSLVIDFLLFKANATGYYFTNLAFFTGVVLLIYAVSRQLTNRWSPARSAIAAFFGAALFAANPLRCESISWVVGRVDIICCFFYLSSYLLFLKSRTPIIAGQRPRAALYKALALVAFFLAMGTKEMAIGLPVLLTVTELIGVDSTSKSIKQRVRDAAVFSAPLWIATIVYFIIRYACLGTLGGGYVAGFGASQMSFMVQRWLDVDTIKRLFFPLCYSLFSSSNVYGELLTACYWGLLGLGIVRLVDNKISLRWCAFLTAWMATAAIPIFQLWGLGFNLEGARFYFFLSVPLCMMAPILLFRPQDEPNAESEPRSSAELKMLVATAVCLTATVCVMGRVAYLTDLEWVHAGKEVRRVSMDAQKLAQSQPSGRLAILGIPKERNGAHQILNGSTFGTMLDPPFTKQALSSRFVTFDPIMFGPPEYINASRFRSLLNRNHDVAASVWDGQQFVPVKLDSTKSAIGEQKLPVPATSGGWMPFSHSHAMYLFKDGTVEIADLQQGDGVRMSNLDVNPMTADFLEFEYKAPDVAEGATWTVCASGSLPSEAIATAPMVASDSFRTARVRLSNYWEWFCQGDIRNLFVQPYPCSKVILRNFKLVSSDLLCPTIEASSGTPDPTGVIHTTAQDVRVTLNTAKVHGAAQFRVDVGKVNYFFNNFPAGSSAAVAESFSLPIDRASLSVDPYKFQAPGFYELRVHCLDAQGKPVGEYSDNLTLRIEAAPKSASAK